MRLKSGELSDWENMRKKLGDFVGKRRHCSFQRYDDAAYHASYKRFRKRINQGSSNEGPAASTPLAAGWQCEPDFEFDTVRQRLELDSPPRYQEPCSTALQGIAMAAGVCHCGMSTTLPNSSHTVTTRGCLCKENAPVQGWVWRPADLQHANAKLAGSDERRHVLKPFSVLDETCRGKPVTTLAAPSLVDDYYTNLLDCSCHGMIALALGSSVYLWNSETHALVGHLGLSPQPGCPSDSQSISCLRWSGDGRTLCIGTRRGELQLLDADHKQIMRHLSSHLSVVRALSWKQQLLSSGSVLGHIHHLDPRAPAPLIGAAVQKEGLCSLQWSPGGDWLASGSIEGRLSIWDSDIAGSHQPITIMKQPSAVKAMGWCPWQGNMIATGGGWNDGQLRIWDTDSGTCVTYVNTNSQICSLRWAGKKRYLVTGHGRPSHHITCWTWDFPSLSQNYQLTGHCQRVLHLDFNPDSTQVFSAGADQRFNIWDIYDRGTC